MIKKVNRQPTQCSTVCEILILLRDFYLEYIKNYYNSIIKNKNNPNKKLAKKSEQTLLRGRCTSGP